jgi:hypothetical protein
MTFGHTDGPPIATAKAPIGLSTAYRFEQNRRPTSAIDKVRTRRRPDPMAVFFDAEAIPMPRRHRYGRGGGHDRRYYRFRLVYSGFEHARVILGGESHIVTAEGSRNALWASAGARREHRGDSLSAASGNPERETRAVPRGSRSSNRRPGYRRSGPVRQTEPAASVFETPAAYAGASAPEARRRSEAGGTSPSTPRRRNVPAAFPLPEQG